MKPFPIFIAMLCAILCFALPADALPRPDTAADGEKLPEHAAARFGTIRFRHGGPITALAVSKDGKYIASGSQDRSIRIWESETGKLLRVIRSDAPNPVGVAFSPDGTRLVTNIDSENLHVFEWATEKPPISFKATIAQWLVWSGDGKHIGCEVADGDSVHIHDAAFGKLIRGFKKATRVAFASDGKTCAVAHLGGEIKLVAIDSGDVLKTIPGDEKDGNISELRFGGDERLVAVHTSGSIAVWDLKTSKKTRTLSATGLTTLALGGTGIVAADHGQLVSLNLDSGERKLMGIDAGDDTPIAITPDGNRLVLGGPKNRVRIWNLTTGKELSFGDGHGAEIQSLAFSADGKNLISAGRDGMRLWDAKTLKERANARRGQPIPVFALAPNGKRFVTGGVKSLDIWEPVDLSQDKPYGDRPSLIVPANSERPSIIAFAPDGNRLVFDDGEKKLVFVDPARGTTFPGLTFAAEPLAAAFGPNGRNLAVLTRDGLLHNWSVSPRSAAPSESKDLELWKKRVQRNARGSVAYSPNGLLIAVSSAGRVVIIESTNGRQWYGFDRQLGDGDVQAVAFSADGRLIAAGHGGPDGIVRIWEVLTGKEVVTFRGHAGGINAVAFAPDGQRIASAGSDSTILLWDLTLPPAADVKALSVSEAWDSLDNQDAKIAYQAMGSLMRAGPKIIEIIETGMKDAIENQTRIRKLIRQLDEDDFRVRRAARTALEKEGIRALPALHEARKTKLAIDTDRQIRLIIEGFDARDIRIPETGLFGESLRTVRSIQVLEHFGGKDAIRVLETLAASKKDNRITGEARTALERLKR